MDLLLALARNGDVRLTTTETGVDGAGVAGDNTNTNRAGAGDDTYLIHTGSPLVVENAPQFTWGTPAIPYGLVEADSGNVKLQAADDLVTDPSSEMRATSAGVSTGNTTDPGLWVKTTGNIDVYGDSHPSGLDPNPANCDGAVNLVRRRRTATSGITPDADCPTPAFLHGP